MDNHLVVMNGRSGSWTIRQGIKVALTFLGQYYAGRGVVVKATSTSLFLFIVAVVEVSDAIEIPLPFPVDDVRHFSQCTRKKIIWEAQYLVPYAQVDDTNGIGCWPIPYTQSPRPKSLYLDLAIDMEVALLVRTALEDQCVGLGISSSAPLRVRRRDSEFHIATTWS
jgi:hypothetical protein